jgi:hypothetical protein
MLQNWNQVGSLINTRLQPGEKYRAEASRFNGLPWLKTVETVFTALHTLVPG